MKRSQLMVLIATLAFARALPRSNTALKEKQLEDDPTTSTSPESSWVPVASPVLRQRSRAFDLDSVVEGEGHQYEDVDIVTAPPKPPDTFSFVVASDFGGGRGDSGAHRSRTLDEHPPEEVELVTASEWFSDWEVPQKIKGTTTTTTTTTAATTTTTTTTATATTTTPKAPRRALPKILIRRRLNSRQRTTTKSPSTTTATTTTTTTTREALSATEVPPLTEAPTTLRVATTTAPIARPTSRPVGSVVEPTVAPKITTTTTTQVPKVPKAPSTTTTSYRTYVNRYGPVNDRDNTILRPLPRETTAQVFANVTRGRETDRGFVAVAAESPTKVRTGLRSGREFQDREEHRGDTVPASTSNAEKLSYILVGVCCAVSITCLVVVVTVLRCRKVRQRQRALEQLQESRNLTVSWLEKTHHAFVPGLPPATPGNGPVPGTSGRKPHRRSATNESSPVKPQNLWFVRREKLPFLLYDHHSPIAAGQGPNVTEAPASCNEAVSDGGSSSSTLGRNPRYQNHPSGHTSGLDCVKKGELIYWSSNNEQLI